MDIVERLRERAKCGYAEDNELAADEIKLDNEAADEIERLRAVLRRIADDDVDPDLKDNASILSGIAWAALEGE